jgi:hypothetical protein
VANFPARASGEQLYDHISKIIAHYVQGERQMLIAALTQWLLLKSEPRTMIAVDIVGRFRLSELRSEIEKLLIEVEQGKAFMPFYARPIKVALALLECCRRGE